jgi:hypothetical protein
MDSPHLPILGPRHSLLELNGRADPRVRRYSQMASLRVLSVVSTLLESPTRSYARAIEDWHLGLTLER